MLEVVTALFESPGDEARRRGLRQMRIVATSLLVGAAIIYLLSLNVAPHSPLGYLNTAAEAAMVGALADWFAVTALFRHPLGLPIPHTALVKRRKNDLGRSLQEFVTTHFLTEDIARERLAASEVGLRAAHWLSDKAHRVRVMEIGADLARTGLAQLSDADIRSLMEDVVIPRLKAEPLSPVAGAFLEGIVAEDAHRGLVDLAAGEMYRWLEAHPDEFIQVVGERAPKWSPDWLDRRVVTWGYQQALDWVRQVRDSPRHPARLAFDDMLTTLALDLQHDEQIRDRAERLKERMLSNPAIGDTAVSLWQSVHASLIGALDDKDSSLWRRGDGWLSEVGERLRTDDALRARLEARMSDAVAYFIRTYGPELATVISHTVEGWDADEAANRIELFVGRDLQFIRINGTVVGALAGLAIHAVTQLIS